MALQYLHFLLDSLCLPMLNLNLNYFFHNQQIFYAQKSLVFYLQQVYYYFMRQKQQMPLNSGLNLKCFFVMCYFILLQQVEPHLIKILAFKIIKVLLELNFLYFLHDYYEAYLGDQIPLMKQNLIIKIILSVISLLIYILQKILTCCLLINAGFKYNVSFLHISSHILLTSIGSGNFSKFIFISWIYFFYLPDLLSFIRYTTATVGGLYLRAKFIG